MVTRVRIGALLHEERSVTDAAFLVSRLSLERVEGFGDLRVLLGAPSASGYQRLLTVEGQRERDLSGIAAAAGRERLSSVASAVLEYRKTDAILTRKIAKPVIRGKLHESERIEQVLHVLGQVEGNYERSMSLAFTQRADLLDESIRAIVDNAIYIRALWLLAFGVFALLLNLYSARLFGQLADEKTITEVLQRAFVSRFVPLANCEIGSAYVSSDAHAAVGGDFFDVYRLSNTLALLMIADVSGKGVDAAVLTAFVKFTMRGISLRRRDPAQMLAEFNVAFGQTVENPYLFLSMFVGILDTEKGELSYASAGHDSAFVRHGREVRQLSVTGPILGVMVEPYETKTLIFNEGDMLVLSTDGLTEARTRDGALLGEEGAMELIAQASDEPQGLADELIARVRARGGNRLRDDIAILAIRVHIPETSNDDIAF